jgi:hypothetical protein
MHADMRELTPKRGDAVEAVMIGALAVATLAQAVAVALLAAALFG